VGEIAKKAECSAAELAYRWVVFDSMLDARRGDAVVFGGSKLGQVEETLEWMKKGSVGEEARGRIEEAWEVVEQDTPLDNWNRKDLLEE
jgi:aflatoxin B1 aldehyde reductase